MYSYVTVTRYKRRQVKYQPWLHDVLYEEWVVK